MNELKEKREFWTTWYYNHWDDYMLTGDDNDYHQILECEKNIEDLDNQIEHLKNVTKVKKENGK